MKLVTKYQIPVINSCLEKCDKKCAYMFNVYKSQLSRQTRSRNLTGPKTLPTIWGTYMKLVTIYQISAINSCLEKCEEKFLWTDGRTEVKQYTLLRWSRGIINKRTGTTMSMVNKTMDIILKIEHINSNNNQEWNSGTRHIMINDENTQYNVL